MGTSLDDFLTDELSDERVAEVVKAKALDPVELIERHLFDGRTFLRRNAAVALAQIGAVQADNLHWVVVATKDGDPIVRQHTTAALPHLGLGREAALSALWGPLRDREAPVVEAAESALEQLTLADPAAMASLLVPRLTDPRPKVAAAAQDLLLRIAAAAAPRLVLACADSDRELAKAAAATLARLGTIAQDALVAGLPAVPGRGLLVRLLDDLPAAAGPARKALEAFAGNDDDPLLASAARRLLDKPPEPEPLGPPTYPSEAFTEAVLDDKALEALVKAKPDGESLLRGLRDARPALRANCAALLGLLPPEEGTGTAVAVLVRDEDAAVRAAAAAALGPLGEARALLVALADPVEDVRDAATGALQDLPATAIGPLSAAAAGAPESVQSVLLAVLATRTKDAVAGLRATLAEAPIVPSRAFAALALGRLARSAPAAADALVAGLTDESGDVQAASALGLVPLGTAASETVKQAVRDAFARATHDAVLRACSRALDAFAGRVIPPLAFEPAPLPMDGFDVDWLEDATLEKAAKGFDVAALDGLLMDGRAPVRANAVRALAFLGEAALEALGGLLLCLKDSDRRIRVAAAETLGRLKLDPHRVVPALASIRDGAPGALGDAIDATILGYGEGAVQPLLGLIGTGASIEEVAFDALASLGSPAAQGLVALLTSDALTLRVAAARGLGGFGTTAGKATRKALARAFEVAEEPGVLRACSAALDAIDGKVPPPAVSEVRGLPVEGFDAETLGDDVLGKAAAKMDVARLGELLFDGREPCRVNAARALGHVGKGAEAFVGALTVALKDAEPEVRGAAAEALGRLKSDPDVVVPGLAAAAGGDRSEAVRDAALVALDAFDKAAVSPLLALLDLEVQRAAVVGVVAARAPKVYLKPLTQALEERESPRAQENAALAIGRLGPKGDAAVPTLLAVMAASDVPLRCIVIRAIGDVAKPSQALVDALNTCAEVDERESVDAAVQDALRALKRRAG